MYSLPLRWAQKNTCKNEPCINISCCKVREKHPEHRAKIQELQRMIKNLEQQSTDEEANIKGLRNVGERAKSSFFAIIQPRLRAQNLIKYARGKRLQLDQDKQTHRSRKQTYKPGTQLEFFTAMFFQPKYACDTLKNMACTRILD